MHVSIHLCISCTFVVADGVASGNRAAPQNTSKIDNFGGSLADIRQGASNVDFHSCTTCRMSKASQFARLVLMNSLRPPYAALEVPTEVMVFAGQLLSTDFQGDYSDLDKSVDFLLGSSEMRRFARLVLSQLGIIGTPQLLSDCCWHVDSHVCFAQEMDHSGTTLCSPRDADHILIASNARGVCALVLQQGNDLFEMNSDRSSGESDAAFQSHRLYARVSGKNISVIQLVAAEFQTSTTLPVYVRWSALAGSSRCHHVYMVGFSLGGALAQVHRFDSAIFDKDGFMSSTCIFSDAAKPCALHIFGTMFPFGNAEHLELGACLDDYSFIVEDDLIAGVPETQRVGVYCPSCPNTLRSPFLFRAHGFSAILGMKTYQLRRNLGMWRSSSSWRIGLYTEEIEIPCKTSHLDWMKSREYIARNESYSHGPLGSLSHPMCTDRLELFVGSGKLQRAASCGHLCVLCLFWVDSFVDRYPDAFVPLPPKCWLHDVYSIVALPYSLVKAVTLVTYTDPSVGVPERHIG